MEGLLVFAAFIASWFGFQRWAKSKGKSSFIAHGGGFLIATTVLVIAVLVFAPETGGPSPAAPTASAKTQPTLTPEQIAAEEKKKRIEKGFSAWDGSHRQLERFIKEAMNDPDSYSHVETVFWDRGDHLVVRTTYRGKNAFGGVVKEWVKAKADLDGNLLEIIEHSND